MVALESPTDPNKISIYCKGAPEEIIKFCSHIVGDSGDIVHLNDT
jgi:magnesium-transporting ATPase (P-type)